MREKRRSNGKMLNEEIINAGYASALTYPPNVKLQECFSKAYKCRYCECLLKWWTMPTLHAGKIIV
ncbi:MAG: hypothetical protein AAB243_01415 [Planctomycetota bacterium]